MNECAWEGIVIPSTGRHFLPMVKSHKLVATLSEGMDTNYECLRVAWMKITNDNDSNVQQNDNGYLLASGGADGVVRLWSGVENTEQQLEWQCVGSLNHFVEDDEERPQIYALQFIQSPSYPNTDILLTSAHDSVYLWTIESEEESAAESPPHYQPRKFLSLLSIQFSHLEDGTQTYQFGGSRNPENELYVFDASYSESNDLLAAALSDVTWSVLSLAASNNIDEDENIQREQCVLSLPPGYFGGRGGHLTAVEWDSSGTRLATCVASGRVILWYLQNVGVGDSI